MIAGVAAAVVAVAGLVLYVLREHYSGRATWERELKRLREVNDEARAAYRQAVAVGADNHHELYAAWLRAAAALGDHRRAGQRAGYLRGAESAD